MRRLIPIWIIVLLLALRGAAQSGETEPVINCRYNQVPFREFSLSVSERTGTRVYCREALLGNFIVTLNADSLTAAEAFGRALLGTGLTVSDWHGNILILKGERILDKIPEYTVKPAEIPVEEARQQRVTESEERYLTGRRADITETLKAGGRGGPMSGSRARVLGRILDEETGEPVFGATVFLSETKSGGVSDVNGFFTLQLKPGNYTATFECMGYEKKKYMLEVVSDGSFTVQTRKAVIQMKEVIVYGDRQSGMKSKDPGLDRIAVKSIRELPMMMGERDILKVSQMLPGIVSTGEGSAGLNVRGGGSDQNAFYINKVPVFNTSHLFGFFPSFNSDIIRDFSVYKGHIPAKYGGRLSSVFNITSRQGNRKKLTVHGGVSPIAGNLTVEGPLKRDTCSILLSARSTYSDWILGRIRDPDIRSSKAQFRDVTGVLNYDLRKTQASLFFYHSKDRFSLSDLNRYGYQNTGGSFSLSRNYGNFLHGEISLIASRYSFSTVDKQQAASAYEHAFGMGHYEARADFRHSLSDRHALEYGADLVWCRLERGNVIPYGAGSLRKKVELGDEQGAESSLYLSDNWELLPWLSATAGARYTLYAPLGPKSVYHYLPGMPVDTRYISDTVSYGDFRPITWYHEPDFRASVNITTDPGGSLKLAFNRMHQNLFMLNTTVSIAPNAQWKLADYHIRPSESNQLSAGVFRTVPKSGLETSAELYYKRTQHYPEFRDGADFLGSPLVETAVLQGKQEAWGVEFFLKRSARKLEGWLSYTWSRSKIRVNGGEAWNSINNGETYPANFDIPHVVNLVLNYHLSRRVTFSSVVVYQKGKPITYPVSVYYINGVPNLDYSSRNAYRIPDYFRTDLSLAIEGNLNKRKLLHSSLVLSLYNATGRDNAYSVYFKTENGRIRSYQYSVIGVPIFTATWQFKLGNYASE